MPQQKTPGDPITGSQGTEALTLSTTAVGLTVPSGANSALVAVEPLSTGAPSEPNKAVKWRYDGQDPTSSVGMPLSTWDYFYLRTREQLLNFKMIRGSDTDVNVIIVYNHE